MEEEGRVIKTHVEGETKRLPLTNSFGSDKMVVNSLIFVPRGDAENSRRRQLRSQPQPQPLRH